MPSQYPLAAITYAAHGTEMDDTPTHEQFHTQMEQDIVAITAELGINPSGTAATVAARIAAAQTRADQAYTDAWAINTSLNSLINARAVIASRFVTLAGTSALGNNALNVRAGTIVITLAAGGLGGCLFPSTMPGSYVPIVCNGDTGTSNGGAAVGVDAWDANGITIHMQRADGTNGSGSVRINYLAIGL
jgi:hypothetical protein